MTKCIYPCVLLYVRLTIKERLREGEQREGYPGRIRCICMTVCYHKGERDRERERQKIQGERQREKETERKETESLEREGEREK